MIAEGASAKGRKQTFEGLEFDVVEEVTTGATERKALIATLIRVYGCGESTAIDAINKARRLGLVGEFREKNPKGGAAVLWLCLPEHLEQGLKKIPTLDP